MSSHRKLKVAIIGSGNIGTDLMIKIMRNAKHLEMGAMVGIDPSSDGLARAARLGVATTSDGIDGLTRLDVWPDIAIDDYAERTSLMTWRIAFLTLAILVFGGVFDRFPDLRYGAIESGAGWVALAKPGSVAFEEHPWQHGSPTLLGQLRAQLEAGKPEMVRLGQALPGELRPTVLLLLRFAGRSGGSGRQDGGGRARWHPRAAEPGRVALVAPRRRFAAGQPDAEPP